MYKKIYQSLKSISLITLLLTVIVILIISFETFNNRLKAEIKSETVFLAETIQDNTDALKNIVDKRITLVDTNGNVLFDNNYNSSEMGNHSDRPEIIEALQNGTGEAERHSITTGKSFFYYAYKLQNGNILRVSTSVTNILSIFKSAVMPIVLLLMIIYLLSSLVSRRITKSIIDPINAYDFDDPIYPNAYDELLPFFKKIDTQNTEITNQMKRIKEQKLRLDAISSNMSEGLIVADNGGNIISANECALNIFDASARQVIDNPFIYFSRDSEINEALKKGLNGEKSSIKVTIKKIVYQIFCSPVFENEKLSGVIMLIFNINEKANAEKIRQEFSANVSHELKTPLTTILGYSQIINNKIAKPEEIIGFTQKIEKEASRLVVLIDDIIKISSLDEQKKPVIMQNINLFEVANEVIESLEKKAEERNITVRVSGVSQTIKGDLSQITELIYNLCDNAIKYNKDCGSVDIIIKNGTVTVKDTGIGIPTEYYDRIFERFFRVDKSRSKKVNGTGLGLSIVKHIALCHNAQISVESKEGESTAITVAFPL